MTGIVVVGEGMVELSQAPDSTAVRLGHGGDALNIAVHLARFGEQVRFLSALGDDPFSDGLRRHWAAEGIDDALLLTVPDGLPGLYSIAVDDEGERRFTYWRGESAARRMFELPDSARALAAAADARLLIFSLISLAILPAAGRAALLEIARAVRANGGDVAFDGNYRPRLWGDADEARHWRDRAIAACTIGLPTFDDERLLGAGDAEQVADRWCALGARETVVKLGAAGCLLGDGIMVPPSSRLHPRDTSGAGDAFDAGYLHARLMGRPPANAALAGHRLAGWVLMRAGAIPPRDDDAPYHG